MAILIDLPNETLVQILSFLSVRDLASTSRVSQRFRSGSQPILYKAPCLLETGSIPPALETFLFTLTASGNETLTTCVRSITFDCEKVPDVPREMRVALTELMAPRSKLDRLLSLAGQNTQFMFLLHLLPRLRVLHMRRPTPILLRYLQSEKAIGPTGPAGLKSLREFHCDHSPLGRLIPNAVVALLQLPCLDYINARVKERAVHPSHALKIVPHSSRVTKLRFADSNLQPAQLSPILSIPIALTHLSYTAAATGAFDIPGFMASLAPVRTTLQYLHLDLQHFYPTTGLVAIPYVVEPPTPFVGEPLIPFVGEPLCEWSALRTLTCPLMVLLGSSGPSTLADVLPLGLRELAIVPGSYWTYGEMVAQVVGLLELKEIRVPALEKVAVVGFDSVIDEQEFARGILDAACQRAGVQCVQEAFRWYM